MRKYIDGFGADATAAAVAFMRANPARKNLTFVKIQMTRWLDCIGPDLNGNPPAPSYFTKEFLLTDCPAAVDYPPLGTFTTANIKRGDMGFSISTAPDGNGAAYGQFNIEWVPNDTDVMLPNQILTGLFVVTPGISALDAAAYGFYDGALVWVYTVPTPTDYDVTTFGACLLNMGIITATKRKGKKLTFTVGCLIDQQDHQVPSQLIEPNSRFASIDPLAYYNVLWCRPFPFGLRIDDAVRWGPWFSYPSVTAPSTPSKIVMNSSVLRGPPPDGFFDGGFLIWTLGPLKAMRRPIARYLLSDPDVLGLTTFQLAEPFPFEQVQYSAGYAFGFTFDSYARRSPLIGETSGTYDGFSTVPAPMNAY